MDETALAAGDRAVEAATRREVLARLGHDLRNPLNLINTALALLDVGVVGEERDRVLGWVRSGVEQMTRLLRDQLELARLEGPDGEIAAEVVDVPTLLRDAAVVVREDPAAPAVVDEAAPRAAVRGDADLLTSALADLARYLVCGAAGATVRLLANVESEGVRLAVAVRGGDRDAAAATAALAALDGVPRPTELPLALARAIVARHGAALSVAAADGETELSFPLSQP